MEFVEICTVIKMFKLFQVTMFCLERQTCSDLTTLLRLQNLGNGDRYKKNSLKFMSERMHNSVLYRKSRKLMNNNFLNLIYYYQVLKKIELLTSIN